MDKIKLYACLILFLVVSNNASASLILDTGATSGGDVRSLNHFQWLAGRFSFDDDVTLTGMEGLLGHTFGGRFEMELYEGHTSIFSDVVRMRPTWDAKWAGVSGLDIDLFADTEYTLVFRGLGLFHAKMAANATDPLDEEFYTKKHFNWHTWGFDREWREFSDHYPGNLGIRLHGEVSTVPVPAAVWLFGSGLLGLIGFARNKA